jgi:tape measure domain-containing protein
MAVGRINILMKADTREFHSRMRRVDDSLAKVGISFSRLASLAGIAFTALAVKSVMAAAKMETLSVSFEVLLGSAEKSQKVVKELFDFAAKTPFRVEGISSAAKQLIAAQGNAEGLQDQLQMLGDISAVTGKDISELAQIYTKAYNKNKLQAEELNQISEAGIPIIRILAEMYGVSAKEIYKMGEAGNLAFTDLQNAFKLMTSEGGIAFEGMIKQSETLQGKWSTLQENWELALANLGEKILPTLSIALDELNRLLGQSNGVDQRLLKQAQLETQMRELNEAIREQEHALSSGDFQALWTTITTPTGPGTLAKLKDELKAITAEWKKLKDENVAQVAAEINDVILTGKSEGDVAVVQLEKMARAIKMIAQETGKIDNVGFQGVLDVPTVKDTTEQFRTNWDKALQDFHDKWGGTMRFASDSFSRMSSLIADGMQNSMNQLTAKQEQERTAAEESGANKQALNDLDERHAKERESRAKKNAQTMKSLASTQAVIQGAMAQLNVWGDQGNGPFPLRLAQSIAVGALTSLEIATINGAGFAQGTSYAPEGMRWVGERGPELMSFSGGEKVFSNARSGQMMGGGRLMASVSGDEFVVWLDDMNRKYNSR